MLANRLLIYFIGCIYATRSGPTIILDSTKHEREPLVHASSVSSFYSASSIIVKSEGGDKETINMMMTSNNSNGDRAASSSSTIGRPVIEVRRELVRKMMIAG